MKKIIVTGGSGFIGTNLIEYYSNKGLQILNLDIAPPQNPKHKEYWHKVDLLDYNLLQKNILDFNPHYLINLAARTDLNGGSIDEYEINYQGVINLIDILKKCTSIERVIFASTMLVCKLGYQPKNDNDFKPNTIYGNSKVKCEEVIKNSKNVNFTILIIRPTSIWGPWFGDPYKRYFEMIKSGLFFNFSKGMATKTFGYVENSVQQIDALLKVKNINIKDKKVFYIGDNPPLKIDEWSNLISDCMGLNNPLVIPRLIIKFSSIFGDLLKIIRIQFPMTSFRYSNMITNNIIDITNTEDICSFTPVSVAEGIKRTLKWMEAQDYR